jgi:hypothetical protein
LCYGNRRITKRIQIERYADFLNGRWNRKYKSTAQGAIFAGKEKVQSLMGGKTEACLCRSQLPRAIEWRAKRTDHSPAQGLAAPKLAIRVVRQEERRAHGSLHRSGVAAEWSPQAEGLVRREGSWPHLISSEDGGWAGVTKKRSLSKGADIVTEKEDGWTG